VRRVSHIWAVIGDSKQLDTFAFSNRNVVMKGAIGVGAGDGVHMQVNGIHGSLLIYLSRKDSSYHRGFLARLKPGCALITVMQ
jgi:hypothetical protein